MDATNVKQFKLDASAGGCTGMFWSNCECMTYLSTSSVVLDFTVERKHFTLLRFPCVPTSKQHIRRQIEAGNERKHVLIRLAAQRDSTQGYADEHPGWVKIDHPRGYWLPVMQHGKAVLHEIK